MKNIFPLFLLLSIIYCTQKTGSAEVLESNPMHSVRPVHYIEAEEQQCFKTTLNQIKCDDESLLLRGKVENVTMEKITFIASPNLSRGKIHLSKPRPLVVDIEDYNGFGAAIGNESQRLNDLKITYFLNQNNKLLYFRSYKFLELEVGKSYRFNADLITVSTLKRKKKIVILKNAVLN